MADKLWPIQVYIARRWEHALAYVENRSIYQLCKKSERSPGTPTGTVFLWEQNLTHWIGPTEDACPAARAIRGDGA